MKISSSNLVMFLLPIVVTPILSRLYLPIDFGEWGVFSSVAMTLTIILFGGYENLIVKASEEELPYVSTLCFIISALLIIVTNFVFYLGSSKELSFFRSFPSITLLSAYMIAYSAHTVSSNICNRYQKYTALAMESVVLGGSQAVFRVLFGITVISTFNGLILGTTIAQIITFLYLFYCIIQIGKNKSLWALNYRKIRKVAIKYKNFALYDAPSSLLCYVGFSIPLLILVEYFDKSTIGCYSLVLQLLLLPMNLIGSAIGRVYYEQLCSNSSSQDNCKICTLQVGKVVAFVSILPMLFLACGGDKLVVLFLGGKWNTAGNIALCLAFWSFPTILTQPLIPLFRFLNKQRLLFLYNLAYSLVAIGSILGGCIISHNLYHILTVYAVTCSLINLSMYFHILQLSRIGVFAFRRYTPLWLLSSLMLFFRILQL